MSAIKLWRVWLRHRRLHVEDVVRVPGRDKGEACNLAFQRIRERAREEPEYLRLGLDLLPKDWEAERVEEIPSL